MKWEKVRNSGKKWEKLGKVMKWEKVGNSGKKWEKWGQSLSIAFLAISGQYATFFSK